MTGINDTNLLLWYVAMLVMGGLGSKIAGGSPVKGVGFAVAFLVGSIGVGLGFPEANMVVQLVASIILAGAIGALMKMTGRQMSNALLGVILAQAVLFLM